MLKQVFPLCGDRHIELSTAGFHAPTKTIPLLKSSDVFFFLNIWIKITMLNVIGAYIQEYALGSLAAPRPLVRFFFLNSPQLASGAINSKVTLAQHIGW